MCLCAFDTSENQHFFMRQLWQKLQADGNSAILARGAIGSFIVKVAGAAIAFGLHILLARLLGVSQYGIYVYALTWVNILAILSLLGLNTALVRFVAAYKAQEKWGLLRGILRRSTETVIAFSLLLSAIVGIVVWFLRDHISQSLTTTFYVALILLPVLTLTRLRGAGLRALRRVVLSSLPDSVIRPLLIAVILIGLYFYLREPLQAMQVMVINLIATIIAFVAVTRWLIKSLPEPAQQTRAIYANREWLKVSLPLLLIASMHIVLRQTDIIMLGAILGTNKAGVYGVVLRISMLVSFGLIATNAIVAPMISELHSTGKTRELQRIITLAARGIFVLTVLVSIVLAILGRHILSLFGQDFIVGYLPLLIFLVGQLINSLAGPVSFLMTMTGHQNQAGLIVGLCAVVNIILNALLIPLMGLVGAAVSTVFSLTLRNILMFFYVRHKLGIDSTIIGKTKIEI